MQPTARRIGMITPSSNTVAEPVTSDLARGLREVSLHVTRLRVTRISLAAADTEQFGEDAFVDAAGLLADARVDVIAWNGTSGSWLGPEYDRRVCGAMERATGGPATTSTLAVLAALQVCEVKRLGLLTPYTGDIVDAITVNYAAHGFPVRAGRHFGRTTNFDFALTTDDELDTAFEELAAQGCDAVAVVCTNLRAAHLARSWEARTGVTVIDSVAATLWDALRLSGGTTAIEGYGRLLATPAGTPEANSTER
ncbi:maleate cis-trans isomerase family protein [Streptomyces albipurpureus]|uniref:Aspartate/glutamate racemase family protein n=1 Tax=Streptomyces albipurpureus TaxID=2897419 RepID=A0ABT0UI66_9ACTN|nr:aspartate/glutamate racemase family protein [Streptomyces sp. CWNU-1]MCM2388158.1 aspartate/glutamate racemase family protein [Streptomyces sp. CWNU-1]